jgi:hypothetical protein
MTLEELLEYHEDAANHIRRTLDLLARMNGAGAESSATIVEKLGAFVARGRAAQAAVDAAIAAPKKKSTRQQAAQLLARFDLKEPRSAGEGKMQIGALTRHGYLRKKGDGYVRTTKAFTV